jgi:hypothetical protein
MDTTENLGVKSRILSVPRNESLVAAALAEYPKAASGHGGIASSALPFPTSLTPMSLSVGEGKKSPRVLDHIAVFAVDEVDPNDDEKVQLRLVRYAIARPGVMSLYLLVPPEGRSTGLVILYSDAPFVDGAKPEDVLERLKENGRKPGVPKGAPPKRKGEETKAVPKNASNGASPEFWAIFFFRRGGGDSPPSRRFASRTSKRRVHRRSCQRLHPRR